MPPLPAAWRLWLPGIILAAGLWVPPEIHPASRVAIALLAAGLAVALAVEAWSRPAAGAAGAPGSPWTHYLQAPTPENLRGAVAIAGGLFASASLSLHPYASLHLLATLAGACAFFLGCRPAAAARRAWLGWILFVSLGVALWALWQAGGGMQATLEAARQAGIELSELARARLTSGRPFGTLLLPAALGGLMAMATPVAAGMAVGANGWRRAACAAAAALFLFVLGLTRSYGAVAAASLAALWAAGRLSPRRAALLRGAVALAALAALALFARMRLADTGQELFERRGPVSQRLLNCQTALRIVARYPILGAGPGAYASAFVGSRQDGEHDTRYAHNTPLQAAAEAGIWILLPLGVALIRLRPRLRRARSGTPEEAGAAAGLVAFLLHNLVDFTAYLPSTLFVGLGLAAALPRAAHAAGAGIGDAPAAHSGGADGGAGPAVRRVLLGGLALACLLGVGWTSRYATGENLREEAQAAARAGEPRREIEALYNAAVGADPGRAALRLERAGFLLEEGTARAEEALVDAGLAAQADAGLAAAHLMLSLAWQRKQDWTEAYLEAEQAVSIHPRDEGARLWLDRLEASVAPAPEVER